MERGDNKAVRNVYHQKGTRRILLSFLLNMPCKLRKLTMPGDMQFFHCGTGKFVDKRTSLYSHVLLTNVPLSARTFFSVMSNLRVARNLSHAFDLSQTCTQCVT